MLNGGKSISMLKKLFSIEKNMDFKDKVSQICQYITILKHTPSAPKFRVFGASGADYLELRSPPPMGPAPN